MGCLRNIIHFIIIVLAVIGFLSIGGREYLDEHIVPKTKKIYQEFTISLDKTGKSFTELSLKELGSIFWSSIKTTFFEPKPNGDYTITQVKGLMGYDTQIAENTKNGQKMVTVETKDKILLDLNKTDKAELKADMLKLAKKHKALPIKFDDIDIDEVGVWKISGSEQKFVKITIKETSSGKDLNAIISTYPDDKNGKMFITFGEKEKFNPKLAEKYFNK